MVVRISDKTQNYSKVTKLLVKPKEINQFFSWVSEGSASFEKRKELFEARKEAVEAEIKSLQETLSLLEFKCWYYSKAMEDGTEEYIQAMLPDKLPSDIQKLYDASHK